MKTTNRIAAAVLAAGLFVAPAAMVAQAYGQGYGNGGYGQGYGNGYANSGQGYGNGYGQPGYGQPGYGPGRGPGGWDAPPSNFTRDIQRTAFRDGLEGARRDLENRRRPDVMNRDEYRNYRGPERRVYRQAFQAGYNAFWRHQGGPGRY